MAKNKDKTEERYFDYVLIYTNTIKPNLQYFTNSSLFLKVLINIWYAGKAGKIYICTIIVNWIKLYYHTFNISPCQIKCKFEIFHYEKQSLCYDPVPDFNIIKIEDKFL